VSVNRTSILYIILTAAAGALVAMTTVDAARGVASGLSTSILLVYTTYTLLAARRLAVAVITAAIISALHIALSTALSTSDTYTANQASIAGITRDRQPKRTPTPTPCNFVGVGVRARVGPVEFQLIDTQEAAISSLFSTP